MSDSLLETKKYNELIENEKQISGEIERLKIVKPVPEVEKEYSEEVSRLMMDLID